MPAPTPWEANREVLARRDPELLARLEAARPPDGASVFPARSGSPALKVEGISLCSQYDPVAEGEALAREAVAEGLMSYAVLGLGLGYHAEALLRLASPESLLFLFEADPGLARLALEIRDLSALLSSPRVHLLAGVDSLGLFTKLESQVLNLFLGFRLVAHPPSRRRSPESYRIIEKALLDLVDYGETALVTAMQITYQTKQNLCMNLAEYAFSPGVSALAGSWAGRPAVVVAAGPSLSPQLPLLKAAKAEGKAAILCVGTALKPCLRAGVVPDLVTTIDYSRLSAKYLEGLPGGCAVPLVVDPRGNWQAIEGYPGPKYFLQNAYLDLLLDHVLGPSGSAPLDTGGTVAHLTYSLACLMGADPVIFVGLDLAYTHHVTHLPGTAIHDQWVPELNRFNTLENKEWEQLARIRSRLRDLPAVGGGSVLTDEQMFSYLQKFQKDWRQAGRRVIDATEGGALKEGVEVLSLKEALGQYAGNSGALPVPSPRDAGALGPKVLEVLDRRLREAGEIAGIYRETLKRLKKIEKRFDDRDFVSKQIQAIDRERKAIDRFQLIGGLVAELTQGDEFTKIRRDKAISASQLKGVERLKAQLERDLDYVAGLGRGVQVLAHMMGLAREGVAAHPKRIPWKDPPP